MLEEVKLLEFPSFNFRTKVYVSVGYLLKLSIPASTIDSLAVLISFDDSYTKLFLLLKSFLFKVIFTPA
ncbi:MAG: hypothetical protein H6613_01005 [Ignavibacteriales bacterium]|nr:hypothetical protein [Ignavibacteriales bacterium]